MPVYKANGKKDGLQKYNVRVNYIDGNGVAKQLTRTAYGLETAKDLERKLTTEQKAKGDAPAKKMTVQQLFDEYMTAKQYEVKDSSLEKCRWNIEYYILPTFKDVRIDRLGVQSLQEWKLSMEQKVSNRQTKLSLNTKKHAFSEFRAMLNYAVKMEYLSKNPLLKIGNFKDKMDIKQEMDYSTAQEFREFIRAAKEIAKEREKTHKDLSEWGFYVFFNIAFYTGLRKGEIFALKWSDIDGSFLSVKRSVSQKVGGGDRETPPKNKSSVRTLQMPQPLIKALAEHKKRQARHLKNFSDDFRVCGGERCLRNTTVERRNAMYSQAAGLNKIRVHDYRHSHASILANSGINIQEVARRLGHARIEMTWNTYSHLYPREEERAVEILDAI